ncbi:MAG: hypothetical protein KatS3mg105_1587 [Gemmatales bacterium]|nr:MAG: hypothetical protein KatS3mg105_1587 [Gemmatales bacterium]
MSKLPVAPFWFKQRQGQMEAIGDHVLRLTAPNLPEAYIAIEQDNGHWKAALREKADGPDVEVSRHCYDTTFDAWNAAFEIYRNRIVI